MPEQPIPPTPPPRILPVLRRQAGPLGPISAHRRIPPLARRALPACLCRLCAECGVRDQGEGLQGQDAGAGGEVEGEPVEEGEGGETEQAGEAERRLEVDGGEVGLARTRIGVGGNARRHCGSVLWQYVHAFLRCAQKRAYLLRSIGLLRRVHSTAQTVQLYLARRYNAVLLLAVFSLLWSCWDPTWSTLRKERARGRNPVVLGRVTYIVRIQSARLSRVAQLTDSLATQAIQLAAYVFRIGVLLVLGLDGHGHESALWFLTLVSLIVRASFGPTEPNAHLVSRRPSSRHSTSPPSAILLQSSSPPGLPAPRLLLLPSRADLPTRSNLSPTFPSHERAAFLHQAHPRRLPVHAVPLVGHPRRKEAEDACGIAKAAAMRTGSGLACRRSACDRGESARRLQHMRWTSMLPGLRRRARLRMRRTKTAWTGPRRPLRPPFPSL